MVYTSRYGSPGGSMFGLSSIDVLSFKAIRPGDFFIPPRYKGPQKIILEEMCKLAELEVSGFGTPLYAWYLLPVVFVAIVAIVAITRY